jgi:uncharacterized protein with PIN domain
MKTISIVLSVAILLFVAFTACQPSKDKDEKTETSESMDSTSNEQMAKVQYTCTMHPEVIKDEPGKCPKCGMDLVKKEAEGHDSTDHQH